MNSDTVLITASDFTILGIMAIETTTAMSSLSQRRPSTGRTTGCIRHIPSRRHPRLPGRRRGQRPQSLPPPDPPRVLCRGTNTLNLHCSTLEPILDLWRVFKIGSECARPGRSDRRTCQSQKLLVTSKSKFIAVAGDGHTPKLNHQSASGLSRCSPDGRSANVSKCSGRSGSEMACSALNHLPRSTSLQRSEQNGPNLPASQSPDILQVGHLVCRPRLFGFGCNRLEIAEHLCTVLHGHAAVRQNLFHAVQNHLLLRR